jgi:hypothetical protein
LDSIQEIKTKIVKDLYEGYRLEDVRLWEESQSRSLLFFRSKYFWTAVCQLVSYHQLISYIITPGMLNQNIDSVIDAKPTPSLHMILFVNLLNTSNLICRFL